tara:strand:- start:404 stop:757 length:354 start_codon:yes stop_codon:yes gene_type:complete
MISCTNNNSLKKELLKMSNDLNKDCPMVIDSYTTLTSTVVIDNSFMYIYKIKQGLLDELGVSKSYWKENQTQNTRNIYCTDPDMLWFRINKVPVIWSYEYLDGTSIGKIEITTDDCN